MSDQTRDIAAAQLRQVIAWEMEAQLGVGREAGAMPPLIADTLLDYFDVSLKPGVELPRPG